MTKWITISSQHDLPILNLQFISLYSLSKMFSSIYLCNTLLLVFRWGQTLFICIQVRSNIIYLYSGEVRHYLFVFRWGQTLLICIQVRSDIIYLYPGEVRHYLLVSRWGQTLFICILVRSDIIVLYPGEVRHYLFVSRWGQTLFIKVNVSVAMFKKGNYTLEVTSSSVRLLIHYQKGWACLLSCRYKEN